MEDEFSEYEFVGGSHDGQKQRVRGIIPPGRETRLASPAPGGKIEIYVLDGEGKWRFDRYGLGINPRAETTEALEELQPIMGQLEFALQALDAVLDKHGGPSFGNYHIGNWVLRHKDA